MIVFVNAVPIQITQNVYINVSNDTIIKFNETSNSENYFDWNESFTGNENRTFYIKIPKNAIIISAKLKLYGYKKCLSCNSCSYNPGTGPDCSCPTGGLSSTELNTLNTSGSCPGGCEICGYTPDCSSDCVCTSPYSGGGVSSCNSCTYTPPGPDCSCPSPGSGGSCPGGCAQCSYTPSTPDCVCTSPYSGGGCADWQCIVECTGSVSDDKYNSNPVTATCSIPDRTTITGYVSGAASCYYGTGSTWTFGYVSLCGSDCCPSGYQSSFYNTFSGTTDFKVNGNLVQECSLGATSNCNQETSIDDTCYLTIKPNVNLGDTFTVTTSFTPYTYCYGTTDCTGSYETCNPYTSQWTSESSCKCNYVYNKSISTGSTKCGSYSCESGETSECYTDTCSCNYCQSDSCTYTPPGPDCSCPSPGSGGSCPGGCEICGYTPDLDKGCQCESPYSGGGCSNYEQPLNPWLDSGDDGKFEWIFSGYFNDTVSPQIVDLNKTHINEWLKTCTPDSNNNCLYPVKIHSDQSGKIRIYEINITYTYKLENLFEKTSFQNIIAGENISMEFHLNNSGKKSPLNITTEGFYLPFNGTEPTTCEINDNIVSSTLSGKYIICNYHETILNGNLYPDKVIKWIKNISITKTQTKHNFYDNIIQVDKNEEAYYFVYGTNPDTVGYSKIHIYSNIPYPSVYSNISPYILNIQLNPGESYNITVNISGIPVREIDWSLNPHYFSNVTLYEYNATLRVYDGNVSSHKIEYLIPISRLTNWNKRQIGTEEYLIDEKSTNFLVNIQNDTINITILTNFSSSSLEEGDHTVYISYKVPYEQPSAAGGGGGGGYIIPRVYYSPKKIIIPIYLPQKCNKTILNITWVYSQDQQATIILSKELKDIIVEPKDGDRILLKANKLVVIPIKACAKLEQKPILVKGYSGYIEIAISMKTGRLMSVKIPVEIRVYSIPTPTPPTPTPPVLIEKIKKLALLIIIIALIYFIL